MTSFRPCFYEQWHLTTSVCGFLSQRQAGLQNNLQPLQINNLLRDFTFETRGNQPRQIVEFDGCFTKFGKNTKRVREDDSDECVKGQLN